MTPHAPPEAPTPAPTITDMVRMALAEAGRPDLADELRANSVDAPMVGLLARAHPDAVPLIARAAHLAHTHAGTPDWPWRSADELAAHTTRWLTGHACPTTCTCHPAGETGG